MRSKDQANKCFEPTRSKQRAAQAWRYAERPMKPTVPPMWLFENEGSVVELHSRAFNAPRHQLRHRIFCASPAAGLILGMSSLFPPLLRVALGIAQPAPSANRRAGVAVASAALRLNLARSVWSLHASLSLASTRGFA
jgi:hypothetical protein